MAIQQLPIPDIMVTEFLLVLLPDILENDAPFSKQPSSWFTAKLEIVTIRAPQDKWTESLSWLPDTEKHLLNYVSWNSIHPGAPDVQLDSTRLLSDEWISSGIIELEGQGFIIMAGPDVPTEYDVQWMAKKSRKSKKKHAGGKNVKENGAGKELRGTGAKKAKK
ncbi:hypothetical protein DFH07DRAFT_765193 [Mycena maculata]|uniref:Uncharacterized protein n=1 Tax=Mycena maculata TaxID=230809 RepID=A0AAD7K8S4_9AGAR|nr:hypothetical protein DFH07DRAFT_765193 [Mycena maculata]